MMTNMLASEFFKTEPGLSFVLIILSFCGGIIVYICLTALTSKILGVVEDMVNYRRPNYLPSVQVAYDIDTSVFWFLTLVLALPVLLCLTYKLLFYRYIHRHNWHARYYPTLDSWTYLKDGTQLIKAPSWLTYFLRQSYLSRPNSISSEDGLHVTPKSNPNYQVTLGSSKGLLCLDYLLVTK